MPALYIVVKSVPVGIDHKFFGQTDFFGKRKRLPDITDYRAEMCVGVYNDGDLIFFAYPYDLTVILTGILPKNGAFVYLNELSVFVELFQVLFLVK
ncbi:MAG: hypothetical protein ACI4I1_06365, partial [Oscillospiraceae bacterium]